MISLHAEPRVVKNWFDFITKNPPYSVALDGYVSGEPKYSPNGPHQNFNHHEGVDRLATRSTCAQVHMAIKQGFFRRFSNNGKVHAHVFINDPDPDACVAYWLLKNSDRIEGTKSELLISRLVAVEDFIDATGGTYPLDPNSSIVQELAWIFEDYSNVRIQNKLAEMNEEQMFILVEKICERISEYADGIGGKIKLNTNYKMIYEGNNWLMITEEGPYARNALFSSGCNAFVSVRPNNGGYIYTLAKISQYVDFPIKKLYIILNKAEDLHYGSTNCWGGSDTIGGSPRMTGSKLKPEEVIEIINKALEKN